MKITTSQCLLFGILSSQQLCLISSWVLNKPSSRRTALAPTSTTSSRQAHRIGASTFHRGANQYQCSSHASPSTLMILSSTSSSSTVTDQGKQINKTQNELKQQEQEEPTPAPILRELYPASAARQNGTLKVDDIHTLYYEVHGNLDNNTSSSNDNENDNQQPTTIKKKRKSALFLHGGPGAGCNPNHARFFDPDLYDTIVLVDQRGCGRSTPRGQVYSNSLRHLVEDCEKLRELLVGKDGVWDVVLGGSWGSTLAVAYAQEYPNRVKSIVLRGVCLLRSAEVDWLFTPQGGAARQNPKAWNQFAETVGLGTGDNANSSSDDTTIIQSTAVQDSKDADIADDSDVVMIDRSVLHAYYDRFYSKNATDRYTAARGWMTWEFTVSSAYKTNLSVLINTANNATNNESSSSSSNNKTNNNKEVSTASPAVLIAPSNSDSWYYQDSQGATLSDKSRLLLEDDPTEYATKQLRKGLLHTAITPETSPAPRPIRLEAKDFEDPQILEEKAGNFSGFPAMPMLTCFYSVNDRFAMDNVDLIAPERMARIQNIPCVAIQGGLDPICPPDTALDVKEQWPGMELRIALYAGHSMYHPELAHELVQASDRMAELL